MAKIFVHTWPHWFTAAGRETSELEWREGMTVGELIPAHMKDAKGLKYHVNGFEVPSPAHPLKPGDHVDFAIKPGGPGVTVVPLIANSLLISTIVGIGAIVAISYIIRAILGRPKGPKEKNDDGSGNASWSGASNTRVEGQPRQVVYGEYRVAPQIVDEFIVTTPSPPTSTLYTLGFLSEGAVSRIGDQIEDTDPDVPLSSDDPDHPIPTSIQVNGNSLDGFKEVECAVRMGSLEQLPIPGFELIVTDYDVGANLRQLETTSAAQTALNPSLDLSISHPYNDNSDDAQQVWKDFAFGVDLHEKADQFTALISFPGGLYRLDSGTGSLTTAGFQCLMRYRELDENGNPYEVGGDNGDGWIYVYPEAMIFGSTQVPFGKEYSSLLQDPQQYVPGDVGGALSFDGINDYATTNLGANDSILEQPTSWAIGANPDAVSAMGWVRFTNIPNGTTASYRPMLEISDPALVNRGISFFLQRHPDSTSTYGHWLPTLRIGNGTTVNVIKETVGHFDHRILATTGTTPWHHVAFTYVRTLANYYFVRIWLDGVLAYANSYVAAELVAAGRAMELGRSRAHVMGAVSNMDIDEWSVWQTELTTQQVLQHYRGGAGLYGTDEDDIVAGWHFDETPGTTTMQDYASFNGVASANDLLLAPSASHGDTGGPGSGKVVGPGSGPAKRSLYRIEVLRINMESSSSLVGDDSVLSLMMGKVSATLSYPNSALLATKIKANDQLSGAKPTTTVMVRGVLCPTWDGGSVGNPNITYMWTKNPAWICLDIATNTRYGRGADYDFLTVDLRSVKDWADYCDGLIYDSRGNIQSIDESGSTSDVIDLRYDSTLFDSFGGIEIFFRTSPTPIKVPPRRWVEGRFVGFTDITFPQTGLAVDITTDNIDGFEIGEVEYTGGGWVVRVKYDKVTYGHPWTDGQFLSFVLAGNLSGNIEGRERRFEYNWVHDTFKGVWDTLVDVAATARAMPYRDGKILRFKVEKPRSPVGLIGKGQIKPGSFEIDYVGPLARANSYTADFWDEDQNFQRSNVSMDDPSLESDTAEEDINRDSITLEGVTRRSQAKRDLYFRLLANRLLTRQGKFLAGIELLAYQPGDVFQLAHDIVPWGKSGRVLDGCTTTTLEVDRQITLLGGRTYFAKIRGDTQALTAEGQVIDQQDTVQVLSPAGLYPSGTSISVDTIDFTPTKDAPYQIYTADEAKLVQVTSVSMTESGEREVQWIDYNEGVFDCDILPEDLSS